MKTILMSGLSILLSFVTTGSVCQASSAVTLPPTTAKAKSRLLHKSSFAENWSRYPTPDAVLQMFRDDFPLALKMGGNGDSASCGVVNDDNRTLLGTSNPVTGRAAVDRPNATFVNWYMNCLKFYIKAEQEAAGDITFKNILGPGLSDVLSPPLIQACNAVYQALPESIKRGGHDPKKTVGSVSRYMNYCHWNKLSQPTKFEMVRFFVERYIGPGDVIADLGIADSEDHLVQSILAQVEVTAANDDGSYDFLEKQNGSTYDDVNRGASVIYLVMITKFLVHMQDGLKY